MWLFNTIAVFSALFVIVVLHVMFLSFMEARWLAKSNAFRRSRFERRRERGTVSVVSEEADMYHDAFPKERLHRGTEIMFCV